MIARFFGRIRSGVRSFLGLFALVLWPRPAELPPESGLFQWAPDCPRCGHILRCTCHAGARPSYDPVDPVPAAAGQQEEPMKKKPKKAPKRKTTKRARKGKSRSAVTGRYVSKATARRKPRETVTERE